MIVCYLLYMLTFKINLVTLFNGPGLSSYRDVLAEGKKKVDQFNTQKRLTISDTKNK